MNDKKYDGIISLALKFFNKDLSKSDKQTVENIVTLIKKIFSEKDSLDFNPKLYAELIVDKYPELLSFLSEYDSVIKVIFYIYEVVDERINDKNMIVRE